MPGKNTEKISFCSIQRPHIESLTPMKNQAKYPRWGRVMHACATQITQREKARLEALLQAANTDYLEEPDSERVFILGRNNLGYPALLRPVESIVKKARSFVPRRSSRNRPDQVVNDKASNAN